MAATDGHPVQHVGAHILALADDALDRLQILDRSDHEMRLDAGADQALEMLLHEPGPDS